MVTPIGQINPDLQLSLSSGARRRIRTQYEGLVQRRRKESAPFLAEESR
jgi:hypothetical protein